VTVYHPKLPFGRLWLVLPSLLLYVGARVGGAVGARAVRRAREEGQAAVRLEPGQVREWVKQAAGAVLWSGSYVLCDVSVPKDRVRVRIRLV
jgi:hypothetical protein